MASLKDIIKLPNAHLRQASRKVGIVTDEIKQLAQAMKDATLDWEDHRKHELGVALAAVQIDKPLKVVVIRNDFDNKEDRGFSVFINPEVTKFEGDLEEDFEGCLSVPNVYGRVPRHSKIRLRALDLDGKEIRITAEGFLARVFQHEIDHTKGVVFIDHIKDKPEAFFKLMEDGELEPLNYEKDVKSNPILW